MSLELKKLESGKFYVYDGDLVGWISCKVLSKDMSFKNLSNNINSKVKIETKDGTILNRFLKIVSNINSIKEDGCVYKII